MTKIVIFHRDNDGYAAASVAYSKFGDDAEYIHVQYGEDPPVRLASLTSEDEVYILDFSYSRVICEEINLRCGKLVILDHHETAEEELKGLDYAIFDQEHSGNVLAYKYFHKNEILTTFHELIQDYDLWRFKYGDETRALNLGLDSIYPDKKDTKAFLAAMIKLNDPSNLEKVLEVGRILRKKQVNEVNKVKYSRDGYKLVEFHGIRFAMYNTGHNINELAEALYNDPEVDTDATLSYFVNNKTVVFNMRSSKTSGIAVNKIAKAMGGGGHKNAAGFPLPLVDGFNLIKELLLTEKKPAQPPVYIRKKTTEKEQCLKLNLEDANIIKLLANTKFAAEDGVPREVLEYFGCGKLVVSDPQIIEYDVNTDGTISLFLGE